LLKRGPIVWTTVSPQTDLKSHYNLTLLPPITYLLARW
jgi:hypothetical protein